MPEPGALERATLRLELADPLLHLDLDVDDGLLQLVARRDVVGRRIDVDLLALGQQLTGERVEFRDPFHLVAEELDPDEGLLRGRLEFQRVAADPETGARHRLVVALVLEIDEVPQDRVAPVLAADPQPQDGRAVVHRGPEAVDARHGRHDDHVAALEQRMRGGMSEPIDLVVPARVLLDVRVRAREIRLGLVVVEVADEVFDRVLREELAELGVQLGGQRLVVGQHQRRPVHLGDDRSQTERLARPGRSEQDLMMQSRVEPVDELLDRQRLVTGGFERSDELQVSHATNLTTTRAG